MRIEVVPASAAHIAAIAGDARLQDVAELWAVGRITPATAMERGLRSSLEAWTGLVDGVPAAMFGAAPYSALGGIGMPWMVGSRALRAMAAQKALLVLARPHLDRMQGQFPDLLYNVVDQRNTAAQRWLRWLGFHLLDPIPVGPDGLPFLPFWRKPGV